MPAWASQQPENGDVIVSCGHTSPSSRDQWARLEPRRVALTRYGLMSVRWIVLCGPCYVEAGGDFSKPKLTRVGEWSGGKQRIIQEPSS